MECLARRVSASRRYPRRSRALVAAGVVLIAIGLTTAWDRLLPSLSSDAPAAAVADVGCREPEAPFADPNFTPVAGQRGPGMVPPIRESGRVIQRLEDLPADTYAIPRGIPEGMSLRLILYGHSPDAVVSERTRTLLRLLYAHEPVPATWEEFHASGGITVTQAVNRVGDVGSIAALIDGRRRHSFLQVGPHRGLARLADPLVRDDLRPWHLVWEDGTAEWSIAGVADPIEIIEIGQSLYCPWSLSSGLDGMPWVAW